MLATGQSYKTERLMKRSSGQLFWASLTGRLINAAEPQEGSIWIVDDIDQQKRAQAELEAVTTQHKLIFDHAMVGIVSLRERKVTQVNPAFESCSAMRRASCMAAPRASGT